MKKTFIYSLLLLLVLFAVRPVAAQAPTATAEEAITGLLNRIGGSGAADRFEIMIDASLAEDGKDVFVITAQNGMPCIKGNNQLSVATGINWYLNHYAHINLTWNNLTTDLSKVTLPLPESEEKHVSSAKYRYDFNTCTFSYSMAFWTWDRWQKEIDWMALHGINAPLNLVGLDVVTRNFLRELGVSESDIDAYIAGPGFIAWFAMNNLEGWGGTINSASTGVEMNGNPDWWYTRQEQLCKNMLQRMRELGMQPVIPGFSGQIPNCLENYTITGFSKGDVINGGTWAGGYTRPDILHPNSSSYATLAPIYYKHLEAIMGVSEFYSMDPFHEGGLPSAVTNATCYPPIMAALDTYHNAVDDATKTSYNVSTDDNQAKWIIQYWQNIPESGAFSSMSSYGDRFIGLDLFSDNIYAGNAAKWRDTGDACYYQGRPYIYCMLHNFGGRSGLHGRLETTMNGYFQALANNNNCQGIGATPEGTETNPILYDMLFELPWMDVDNRPTADEWLKDYAYARYGINPAEQDNANALEALKNLKKSVWDCKVNQQGTSEAVILARPAWSVGSVSAWSTSAIYWDTQDVRLAADQLISIADLVTENGGKSGVANYNYDAIDVIRQAMVDYAAELLPLIKAAYDSGNTDEYTRLYTLYLDLMLDLDEMLSYDENFKLERWTSLARNIAKEGDALGYTTTENDRNWLEWNARTQVTVWSKGNTDLHDYSNRCWAGLIKDFHYKRWKHFFENNGGAPSGGWFSGFEYPWTVDFNDVYDYAGNYSEVVIPSDMTATAKAAETFGNYFGRVKGATKNYIFPMGVATNATKSDVIPEVYRGQTVELPLTIGKSVTVSSVQIDLNGDGAMGNTETLAATGMNVTIPDDAAIGKTKAIVEFSDGTVITFNLAIIEDITENRTVTAATADANMGTVAIEGTSELTITNMEAVKITATAKSGYNFENWTDDQDNVVSNDNPYIYYGKEEATFTANFIQDKWGVPASTASGLSDATTNNQYVSKIDFAYHNREAETIYDATSAAPTSLFITIPQIIDVPQGASFTITWTDNGKQDLTKCFMSAYMDFNANGDFSEEGELVKVVGTRKADNSAVRSGSFQVILPYDAPTGITHLRMRFDSAWGSEYNSETGAFNPKGELDRMCYEVILNIIDKSDKAAHVVVESNNTDWGTVEVWTDETPDGSTGTEWDVSSNIPMYLRATKAAEDVVFLGWYDHYGRLLTNNLEHTMYGIEDAHYTAKFLRTVEIDGWVFEYRTEGRDMILTKIVSCGDGDITIPERTTLAGAIYNIVGFDNGLFNNCKELLSITLPASIEFLSVFDGDVEPNPFEGCANLDAIAIDGTCDNYYVDANGDLYNYATPNQLVCSPAGKEKGAEYRALGELIEDFSALIGRVATVDPVGTVAEIALQATTEGDPYYIWCSNPHTGDNNDAKGGVAALLDEDNSTYLHTNYSTISATNDFLQVELGTGNELAMFKIGGVQRSGAQSDFPITIEVRGSSDKQTWTTITTVNDIPQKAGSSWQSDVIDVAVPVVGYPYLKFIVTTGTNRIYFHMAKFDLYKVSSSATVHAAYSAAGITADMVASDYDALVTAIKVYNNGTTAAEMQAQYNIIEPLYTNLKALADAVYSGVFQINYQGDASTPVFIQYNTQANNGESVGYKLIGTCDKYTADAAADKLFTITPSGNGYTFSAQGKYLGSLTVTAWKHVLFSDNEADAGVYLFEETTTAGIYKLKVESGWLSYLNGYDNLVFGSNNTATATFGFARVEEYTLTVPESGYTTLCLPFNVVLPEGVTAYDIIAGGVYKFVGSNVYELNTVATEGETLAKGTPVIIKATAGDHVFEITMDNDGAKGSTEGSVLRSGLVKTTIGTVENNYTFADGTFTLVTASTDVPANQCWMVLDEQFTTSIINKEDIDLPFKLTTDEYFPELYNIRINRGDGYVLGYEKSDSMVPVQQKTANNIYQAWYFKATATGVVVLPFNADGKVLGAKDVTDGPGKVTAAADGTQTYDEWLVVESPTTGWYNIYTVDGSGNKYYFSNHSNTGHKMGFWSGDGNETTTKNDGGSQFQFIVAEFGGDNPRYYQLQDLLNTMDVTTQAKSGDAPGCRDGGDEHYAAYTAANALITAGNTSDYDDCYTAYTNLRATRAALGEIKQPVAGTVYRIRNYITDAYDSKKNHYIANSSASIALPTAADENTTLWVCVAGETEGTFKFISAMGTAEFGWQATAEHAQEYTVKAGVEQGAVALAQGTTSKLLALTNEDHSNGLEFNYSTQGAMQKPQWSTDWYLEPVDGATVYYSRSIPKNYSYGTLYLPFSVTIPDGVDVYTAEEDIISENGKYYVDLVEVSGIIPARTAVILYREDKTSLQEFRFDLTFEAGAAVTGNVLDGCVITSAVGGDADMRYYLLFRGTKGEAFYWMKEEFNEILGSGTTHIKCEGNKAYMALAASNFTSGQSSTIGFRFPGTTDIEEITDNRVQCTDVYDLQGRKLSEITEPGIYIIDGKKVLVK